VRRLTSGLNRRRQAVNGSRIFLLGMAYKRNTSDSRESPAMVVAERLVALGADVVAADPHIPSGVRLPCPRVDATPEEAASADAVVLLTDHDSFDLDSLAGAASYFLDTRHRVNGSSVEHL
jgi:UDP-N-acetyl-D-glucosamine dehydrogenase